MERYTNNLMLEMCKYMTDIGKALENFARDGEHCLVITGCFDPLDSRLVNTRGYSNQGSPRSR